MSVMVLAPVFKCRYGGCETAVEVRQLCTTRSDEEGKRIRALMQGLQKIALCDWHKRQRNWYATQGRADEWEAMARENAILLVVRDPRKEARDAEEESNPELG